jgi:hypothetical protein
MKSLHSLFAIFAMSLIGLSSCVAAEPKPSAGSAKGSVQPLTAETGPGSVTIRDGQRTLAILRTVSPNIEETRWVSGQGQIAVKSRGNHGPATIELFDCRTGAKLGKVMAYAAADGPAWARDLAEGGSDRSPRKEETPSVGPVPQKIIEDCLVALRKDVGNETGMKVLSAKRGETGFIIDVRVESAEKPWRCFHDGTRCTGTQYQGEG